MRKYYFLITFLCAISFASAQNPETTGRNWTVTKLANTNQLVSYPNEISYGPDGWLWITERSAQDGTSDATNGERVVRVDPNSGVKTTMLDLHNEVYSAAGQDGLMGMAIHPDLYTDVTTTVNNYVYLALTYFDGTDTTGQPRRLRIVRFDYDHSNSILDPSTRFVLIENMNASNDHNSGRMKIGPDLKIYYTVGDQGHNQFANKCKLVQSQALPTQSAINAQDWSTYQGKTLRMNLDGSIPVDNPKFFPFEVADGNNKPFSSSPIPDNADTNRPDIDKVRSHIYTYGHRNAQGIIFDSNGTLFQSEHGDRVDDEVNVIVAGKNYGWPFIVGEQDNEGYEQCIKASASGCNTNDNECPSGSTTHPETSFALPVDFQGPIATYNSTVSGVPQGGFLTWPTVAPSSIDVYEGNGNLPFSKNIFIPTLKRGTIYRYGIDASNNVTTDLIEFHSSIDRYRDMTVSPDGNTIYAVTDSGGSTSGPTGSSSLNLQNPGAVIKIEFQVFPEPSNQVTNFTATESGNDIQLTWDDTIGTNIADGYVIAVSTTANNFSTYVDGVQPNQDLDISDGSGLIFVENGVESYTFDDLEENTTYYFQITAYSNLGTAIDFLTTPAAPEANATTTISLEPTIIITEVVSNSISEAYVEIFNYGTSPVDLNAEGFYLTIRYDGGSGSDQVNITATLQPGDYYTIGRPSGFFTPDLTAFNVINGDGNDPYVLYNGNDEIVDIYGIIGQNGTGQAWDYSNSRSIRKITVSEANNTWTASEWIIEGISNFNDVTPNAKEDLNFVYNNSWSPYDPSGSSYHAEDVTIQNGVAPLTDMTLFKNVDVQSGTTLDLASDGIILTENLMNNGTIIDEDATIVLAGNDGQQITGNNFEISELYIDNETTVNVDVAVKKLLTIDNDLTINTLNEIILKSTSTGTAFVDEVNGTVNGTFMVERYIPGKRAFRFMSPSVTTTGSVYENWQESGSTVAGLGTHITGSISGANGFDASISGNHSLFIYDNIAQVWNTLANTDNTTLSAGTPYRVLVRGDRTVDLSINAAVATNTVIRTTGTLKAGTETVTNLSSDAGAFNFVGNPYQAPVDLSQVLSSSTNVNPNFVYFWDPTLNTRGGYITVDVPANSPNLTSDFNKFVQPNSSFFISTLANGPASMIFEESHKNVDEESLNIFSAPNNDGSINIKLFESTEFSQNMRERDAVIMSVNASSNNIVNELDALKLTNIDENIAIQHTDKLLSIEKRQPLQDGDVVKLYTSNYRALQYELNIQIDGVLTQAYLKDTYLNSYTLLNTTGTGVTTYSFTIDQNVAESMNVNRFQIEFSNVTLSTDDVIENNFTIYPNPTNDLLINITGVNSEMEFKLFNMLGQEIKMNSQSSISFDSNSAHINLPKSLVNGTYIITITDGNNKSSHKVIIE